jgi:hypothetical protein
MRHPLSDIEIRSWCQSRKRSRRAQAGYIKHSYTVVEPTSDAMTNLKKTAEISIRLPKQASLPKPAELIGMAHEARRAKKRIEMPWQPDGRPHPVLITVDFDENSNKSTWSIHNSHYSEAKVEWSEIDPDPTKVILALRDWYARARETETWFKSSPVEPAGFEQPAPAAEPQPIPQPQQPAPYPPPAAPGGYPPQGPYPQTPGGVPSWTGYPQQQQYQYPNPYAVPPAPPHWAQSAPQAQQPGAPPDQRLSPELWALHGTQTSAVGASTSGSPKLGDLLVAAGVIPTRTLQAALTLQNTSEIERRKIGEILVTSGALPSKVLDAAVRLQEMARDRSITNQRVTELLRQMNTTGCSLDELLKPVPPAAIRARGDMLLEEEENKVTSEERKKVSQVMKVIKEADLGDPKAKQRCADVLELLQKASIVSKDAVESELKANKDNAVDAVKALLVKETIEPTTFEAALGCQKLIELERFKVEQAVIALGYCSRSRVGLKDAISDLNWLIPMDGI